MKKPLAPLLVAACAALAGPLALAEKADRNKPMAIEADALRYDDQKRSSTFTGRVVVNKGTIVMRGARMDVRQDPDGAQFGLLTAETGQRAFFRQKREGLDEYTEAEGELIEYDGRSDRVKLTRRAELRRYRGATLYDQINGNVIVFDNTTEVFTVDGKPASASDSTPGGGRVRAMLTPFSAASAPAAPASAAQQPAPRLRASTGLGGERP